MHKLMKVSRQNLSPLMIINFYLFIKPLVYTSDDMLIQKNTTVFVGRVPISTNKKQWKEAEQNLNSVCIFSV